MTVYKVVPLPPRQSKRFGRYGSPLPWLQRKKKHTQSSQPLVLATSLSFARRTLLDGGARAHSRARGRPPMRACAHHEVVIGRENLVHTESSTIRESLYPRKFPAIRYTSLICSFQFLNPPGVFGTMSKSVYSLELIGINAYISSFRLN